MKVLDDAAPVRCLLLSADRDVLVRITCELGVSPHGQETHRAVRSLEAVVGEATSESLDAARSALQQARVFHAHRSTLDYWYESMPMLGDEFGVTVESLVSEHAATAALLQQAITIVDGYLAGASPSVFHRAGV